MVGGGFNKTVGWRQVAFGLRQPGVFDGKIVTPTKFRAIYGRNFQPQDIPAKDLDFLLYAFADVKPSGEVFLTDCWSDIEKHYPDDSWSEPGTNAYGCVKQIFLHKKANRNLKVLLSIGGWTFSSHFAPVAGDPDKRMTFARSAVSLVQDIGFDGIDIDWEYPQNHQQGRDFVELLKVTREALDESFDKAYLAVAAPAGSHNYEHLLVSEMDKYDYCGSWAKEAGHTSNLYGGSINTDSVVDAYLGFGVAPGKLVIGCPLYGRSFMETDGPGTPFCGVGPGSWEEGVWDYKALPLPGAEEHFDAKLGASWSFDEEKRMMVSYDTVECARVKAMYAKGRGLGGLMFWETSGDHPEKSIIGTVSKEIGDRKVEENNLDYPGSKFGNIRKKMT